MSDPYTEPSSNPPEPTPAPVQTAATKQAIAVMKNACQTQKAKKQTSGVIQAAKLGIRNPLVRLDQNARQQRSVIPPPVRMELIRPGKRKVRIPDHAVNSTPPKRMRAS